MIKLLTRASAVAVLLFVIFMESAVPARGQGVGVYRGRQGRRVGRVTLPTPPYNPNAGILNKRGGVRESPKATRRRTTRRSVKAAGRATPRRRRVRRGRNLHPGTPRVTTVNRR